jgi:polar amino acid transport system substrate-binding protein
MAPPLIVLLVLAAALPLQRSDLASRGRIRAAFIADNPIQGRVDRQTGIVTGLAADLTRELARRLGVPFEIAPLSNPDAVIATIRSGDADIGFLAFESARAEQVSFSEPYVLSTSAYLVRADSDIRSSADVDRAGMTIGAVKGQSQQIYISSTIKRARVEILPVAPAAGALAGMVASGTLDAFGANRQRVDDAARTSTKVRVLSDSFMVTAQAIVVTRGSSGRLDEINRFLAEVRESGFLKQSLAAANVSGVEIAAPR